MKTKKLLSVLLAVLLVAGMIPAAALTVSADGVYTDYYYEDFEGFSTDMNTAEISERLGWTTWDASVANLKIVNVNNNLKLQIVPVAANRSTSATLISGIDIREAGVLLADFEIIPVKADTISDTTQYESGSRLMMAITFPITGESGANRIEQGLSVAGRQVKRAVINGSTYAKANNSNSWNTWYNTATRLNKPYGTIGVNNTNVTYYNGETNNYLFTDSANADGYPFIYRMRIDTTNSISFRSYVATYTNSKTATASSNFIWTPVVGNTEDSEAAIIAKGYTTSQYPGDMCTPVTNFLNDGNFTGKVDVSFRYEASGVSFYVDNILVSNRDTTTGNSLTTITVDGAARKVVDGVTVLVNDFTPAGKQLLYAEVNGAIKYADDTVTLAEGTTITTHAVEISMVSGAQARLNDPSGLRWQTKLNQADLDALAADANLSNLTIGTVILPESYYNTLESLSFANLESIEVVSGAKYLNVDATVGKWFDTDAENYIFAGSLAEIKESHYETDFIGVGYLTAEIDGRTVELFAEPSGARSVRYVANAALADVSATQEEIYQYAVSQYRTAGGDVVNGDAYSPYTEAERAILWGFFGQ